MGKIWMYFPCNNTYYGFAIVSDIYFLPKAKVCSHSCGNHAILASGDVMLWDVILFFISHAAEAVTYGFNFSDVRIT